VKANEGYLWLRRTGLYWLFWCETTAMALFMSGFISAPVLAAFGVRLGIALGTAAALVGAGIVLASIESYLLQRDSLPELLIQPEPDGRRSTRPLRDKDRLGKAGVAEAMSTVWLLRATGLHQAQLPRDAAQQKLQRTRHGKDGASPLNSVLCGHRKANVGSVRYALVLVGTVACSGQTPAARTTPEPMAILKATAQRYSGLRSYHFVSTTETSPADGSQSKTMGQVFAGTPEGKTRYEMDTPFGRVVVVSDGKTEWTYFPATNEYVVSAAGSGPLPDLRQEFIRSYAEVDASLVRAEWLRVERLSLGGKSVTCDVIRVDERRGWPAVEDPEADRLWRAEWMNVPKTYWIDREKHRILRVAATSTKGARQETTYSIARVDQDVPVELFGSPVPPGATKVEVPR
jgi:outer membrane lipoprotein-sorting protein